MLCCTRAAQDWAVFFWISTGVPSRFVDVWFTLKGMKQIRLCTYANNEVRYGWDDIPYVKRTAHDDPASRSLERLGIRFQADHEDYLRDNKLFCFRDKDGTLYKGNPEDGYERAAPTREQLDIIAESQQQNRSEDKGRTHNYGSPVKPTAFTRNARHRLLEAGSCFDIRLGESHCGYFGTFTLPGSTERAYDALSRWSGYVANRLTQVIRRLEVDVYWFYVWELQKRGALHLHLFVALPKEEPACNLERDLRRVWYSALESIGDAEGICLFKHEKGEYCTVSQKWQFDWQRVSKSPAAYISKYVSKSANAPVSRRDAERCEGQFLPHRWWSMSRNYKRLIEEERFDVCIHAISDDDCIHAMKEMDDFIADIGNSTGYEYYAEIGAGRDNGNTVGVTYKKIRYFPPDEWPVINALIQHKWWQIVKGYAKHFVRFAYDSDKYQGVYFRDVL